MTIAEKLSRAKTDIDEVYEKGHEVGYENGKMAQYNEFWDIVQAKGTRRDYSCAFAGAGWTDETFKPKYDITAGDAYHMFYASGITNLETALNGKKLVLGDLNYTFTGCKCTVISITSTPYSPSGYNYTFSSATRLTDIKGSLNVTPNTYFVEAFYFCSELVNVTFKGTIGQNGLKFASSTKLSKASWENIIGCLSATSSGLSMTGSLASVNKAFETSEGANDGSTSTEWLNLIATKPNWTINLV